jgi:hypothetical protein
LNKVKTISLTLIPVFLIFFAIHWFIDPFYIVASGDIERICQAAEEFEFETDQDAAMTAMKFSELIEEVSYSRHTKMMMEALAHADSESKFELFNQGAQEFGTNLENCEALKRYMENN